MEATIDESAVNTLDDNILRLIFIFVIPRNFDSQRIILRSVCRRWNRLATVEKYHFRPTYYKDTIDAPIAILMDCAFLGYTNIFNLAIVWFKKNHKNFITIDWHEEHPDSSLYNRIFAATAQDAAINGHLDICRFSLDEITNNYLSIDRIMSLGAKGGHERICSFAKTRGVTWFDGMFTEGLRNGHDNICRLATSWDATPTFNFGDNHCHFGTETHLADDKNKIDSPPNDRFQLTYNASFEDSDENSGESKNSGEDPCESKDSDYLWDIFN